MRIEFDYGHGHGIESLVYRNVFGRPWFRSLRGMDLIWTVSRFLDGMEVNSFPWSLRILCFRIVSLRGLCDPAYLLSSHTRSYCFFYASAQIQKIIAASRLSVEWPIAPTRDTYVDVRVSQGQTEV